MGMGDHGFVCLGPVVFVPEKPGILWLIKNKQGLVAYLGKFRSPPGAALDGAVRLDCADNDDLLAAADLPADGLQNFAEKGCARVFAAHEARNVGQADILEGQFFRGEHPHAARTFDLVTFKAVVYFFHTPAFGQSAEELLCSCGAAAVKHTLVGGKHGCPPQRIVAPDKGIRAKKTGRSVMNIMAKFAAVGKASPQRKAPQPECVGIRSRAPQNKMPCNAVLLLWRLFTNSLSLPARKISVSGRAGCLVVCLQGKRCPMSGIAARPGIGA